MKDVLNYLGLNSNTVKNEIEKCQNLLTEVYEICEELYNHEQLKIYGYDNLNFDLMKACVSELSNSMVNFDDLTNAIIQMGFNITKDALDYIVENNNLNSKISFDYYVSGKDSHFYINLNFYNFDFNYTETSYEYYEKYDFKDALIIDLSEPLHNLIKSELNIDYPMLNIIEGADNTIRLSSIIKSVLESKLNDEIINAVSDYFEKGI